MSNKLPVDVMSTGSRMAQLGNDIGKQLNYPVRMAMREGNVLFLVSGRGDWGCDLKGEADDIHEIAMPGKSTMKLFQKLGIRYVIL
jgi:hypothetical protein